MRANERTDERVAQHLRLDSCLFQTTVPSLPKTIPTFPLESVLFLGEHEVDPRQFKGVVGVGVEPTGNGDPHVETFNTTTFYTLTTTNYNTTITTTSSSSSSWIRNE